MPTGKLPENSFETSKKKCRVIFKASHTSIAFFRLKAFLIHFWYYVRPLVKPVSDHSFEDLDELGSSSGCKPVIVVLHRLNLDDYTNFSEAFQLSEGLTKTLTIH